jgi:hypothetical protein
MFPAPIIVIFIFIPLFVVKRISNPLLDEVANKVTAGNEVYLFRLN